MALDGRGMAWPEMSSLLDEGVASGLADRELLDRFVTRRDRGGELAFTTLVARHGPMVLAVCRRILRDPTEADDAFQATFLVLARKAPSIRLGDSLGPWLRGVSTKVARRLQSVASRRRESPGREGWLESIADRRRAGRGDLDGRLDLAAMLDDLPDAFRAALRLCYLEGLTHHEAAERLGCPVGTVRSRLSRGRALLRRRLEADSTDPRESGGATPILAPALIQSTARAAARLAAGQSLTGVVPARALEVATGVIPAMSTKTIAAALVVTIGSLAGWGALVAARPENGTGGAPQAGRREIDRPPASLLRGDFDPPRVQRRVPTPASKSPEKPAAELPADFPPFVVETVPKLGDVEVDAARTKEIRVTFSKRMRDKSWSWTSGNLYAFPEGAGDIHYLPDHRTCVFPVKLEPGKTYVIGINGARFNGFQDPNGAPALIYSIGFRTKAAK